MSGQGKVYLVGAGPGDPGLITAKGLRCLRDAQVVVYDRLVSRRLLEEASTDAEMVNVGKARGDHQMRQEEINQLLVEKALEGKRVVRLKGGDPFIFGRGGEEADTLADAGVLFEIVPGITSAIAAAAYAGIPLTHRRVSSYVTIVSGSEEPSKVESSIDWERLASGVGTLVVLMGWETLPGIVDTLKKHGLDPTTPVALIQWGTEPYQRTVVGSLDDILERGRQASLTPPVVAVFGQVVKLREKIHWFDDKPLFGKRVLVPRTRDQASVLSQLLMDNGAEPLEIPTIEIKPVEENSRLDSSLTSMSYYDWVVFSSANGVREAFKRLDYLQLDARAFGGTRVCAIGSATAETLRERGILADFRPRESVSESIVTGLTEKGVNGSSILLLRAEAGRDILSKGLSEAGALVDDVAAYRTVMPEESGEKVQSIVAEGRIDVVAFTSSSTVTNLLTLLGGDATSLGGMTLACIGPITAETARNAGLTVNVVATESTVPGLVDALVEYFSTARGE
ncbi:MAG: uroporphyrinogen-III C-methyltransferase [Chloroflexi bacterium]|nr:uroporphyrinogen-III C-methyltransferase [Chloroflexota bacterium]